MEKDINENVNENENNVEDFIKEVEDLKKNSVSREDYGCLQQLHSDYSWYT